LQKKAKKGKGLPNRKASRSFEQKERKADARERKRAALVA